MLNCTVVVVNEALEKHDVTFAAKPRVQLKAVPYGSFKRQLVRQQAAVEQEVFAVYEAVTNMPAELAGMAMFLTICDRNGVVTEVKGKIDPDTKGLVSFKVNPLDKGFYSYDITVKANNYAQCIIDGSYVITAQN